MGQNYHNNRKFQNFVSALNGIDKWRSILLMQEKEQHDRVNNEERKEQELNRRCKAELLKQIKEKERLKHKQTMNEYKEDAKLIQRWRLEDNILKINEMAKKHTRMVNAKNQFQTFYKEKSNRFQKNMQEKSNYNDYLRKLQSDMKMEYKIIENIKKLGQRNVCEHNKSMITKNAYQKKKQASERLIEEKTQLKRTLKRLEYEENKWRNDFKRREEETYINQQEAVKRLEEALAAKNLELNKRSKTQMRQFQQINLQERIRDKELNMAQNKNNMILRNSLKESLRDQEEKKMKVIINKQEQLEMRRKLEKEIAEENRRQRIMKMVNANKDFSDLSQQIFYKTK